MAYSVVRALLGYVFTWEASGRAVGSLAPLGEAVLYGPLEIVGSRVTRKGDVYGEDFGLLMLALPAGGLGCCRGGRERLVQKVEPVR
eukprot:scaffold381860_cov23-Prasinocladus_malaysianus.AAC.1